MAYAADQQIQALLSALASVLGEVEYLKLQLKRAAAGSPEYRKLKLELVGTLERTCNLVTLAVNAQSTNIDKETQVILTKALEEARASFIGQSTEIVLQRLDEIGNTAQRVLENRYEFPIGIGFKLKEQLFSVTSAFNIVFTAENVNPALLLCVKDIKGKVEELFHREAIDGIREIEKS